MAEPHLSALRAIMAQMEAGGGETDAVVCKHFFSGAVAYIDEHVFMSLSPVGLALKMSQADCATLFAQGATPLRYFPKAPIKKGYAVLPSHVADNQDALDVWIARSMAFVRQQAASNLKK